MSGYIKTDDGLPDILFHYTKHEIDISSLLPFTHFGTCQAAHERWCGTGSGNPGARFFPVLLKMSNPLEVKDSGDLDIFFGAKELIKTGVDRDTLEWIYRPLIRAPISREAFHVAAGSAHSYHDFQPQSQDTLPQETLTQRFLRHIGFGDENIITPMNDGEVAAELCAENFYRTEIKPDQQRAPERPAQNHGA